MPNFSRQCPNCIHITVHKTRSAYYSAIKNNSKCLNCKYKCRNNDCYRTLNFREKISKISKSNTNNWMTKLSVKEKLLEKYGPIDGKIRFEKYTEKQRINSSGKNNPMYGKPTPKKAGNGWSGWYNQQFFRSLRELSYIINVLEKYNLQWQSAENIRISYINYDGNERTYSPDYLVNNTKLVEIKPKRLHNTPLVKLKKEAAEKYCLENKLVYELIDIEIIDIETLRELVINNKVTLTEKTKEKLNKWKKEN